MLQALMSQGQVQVVEVPRPIVTPGSVLIKVFYSCISTGTEVASVTRSGESLLTRVIKDPKKIPRALKMMREVGISETLSFAERSLGTLEPFGYSASGEIVEVGGNCSRFRIGDRVAAAGVGHANHAEFVNVPVNLVTKLPNNVEYPEASTVALGAIAMHAVRRAKFQFGEFVVILGVGLIGQLVLQMCKAAGARVIAVDIDDARLELAKQAGAEVVLNSARDDSAKIVYHTTGAKGADCVIFAASTADPQVLSSAFAMCRHKGKVIMVGVYGTQVNRDDIYKKELDFLISTSYGPGRYDDNYELQGIDYPYGHVRWTEQRNMEEYLRLISTQQVMLKDLIGDYYPIAQAAQAFDRLRLPTEKPLILLLSYASPSVLTTSPLRVIGAHARHKKSPHEIRVALVGAGSFAKSVHVPNIIKLRSKFLLHCVTSRSGSSAQEIAQRYNASYSTTNFDEVLQDPNVDLVLIATRHNLHADMVLQALQAGKNVFVEKPLCVNTVELEKIKLFFENHANGEFPLLMVGFNRRFSPLIQEALKHVRKRVNPLHLRYRMNAGYLPPGHWVNTEQGGGRIVGEACHIIDLLGYITGSDVSSISVSSIKPKTGSVSSEDNRIISLEYEDGSIALLEYFSIGSKLLPKELFEIHFDEKSIIIEDYKFIRGYGLKLNEQTFRTSEKGHYEELLALHAALGKGGPWPISLQSMLHTTEITFKIKEFR